MQANPRLGILQTLVTGQPAESAFARIFQFGMRHSMRTHTIGIAWWQGPSGPYWGHNAIIRLQPFIAHCRLPLLPGRPPLGGPVLSHDQVEAALMRAAGYEVRVIADEFESWEENPPSLPDFIKRDLRWCQGNMQYLRLLARPGLKPMGRFQLVNAIFMYLGAPFWILMLAAGLAAALMPTPSGAAQFPAALAFALYFATLAIGFAPRVLGVIDILLQPARRAAYGGTRTAAGRRAHRRRLQPAHRSHHDGRPDALPGRPLLPAARRLAAAEPRRPGALPRRGAAWALAPVPARPAAGRRPPRPGARRPALGGADPGGAWASRFPSPASRRGEGWGGGCARLHLCAVPDEYAPAPELRRLKQSCRGDAAQGGVRTI